MRNRIVRSIAIVCVWITLMLYFPVRIDGQAEASTRETKLFLPAVLRNSTSTPPIQKVNFDFSPYIDGQDPNMGTVVSEAQIRERLSLIAPYSKWVRSFGCGSGLEVIGRVGHEMGLKVAVGAWISRDNATNQSQINCLITEAYAENVDLAIVGSEALLRSDVTVDTLIQYLDQVRAAIPASIPVATADVYSVLLDNPSLIDHVDVVMPNIYPFWEGYPIQNAVAFVDYWYDELVTTFAPKPVYISETGWPSCGSNQDSVGSLANAAEYFNQVVSWSRQNQVTMFYFDALDESWKTREEGEQGACWGVFDKNGVMKPGMETGFTSDTTPHNPEIPLTCGSSDFSFQYTSIPAIGSYDNVKGKTCGIVNLDYNIVLFIKVGETWWVKPYQDYPYTTIARDGSWEVDYTTGGIDQQATILRAYLLPRGVDAYGDITSYPHIDAVREP